MWASQVTSEINQPYRGNAERAEKYPLTLHASVYGCLALNTYQQVSKLGNLKKEEPRIWGTFQKIFPQVTCSRILSVPVLNSEKATKGSIQN